MKYNKNTKLNGYCGNCILSIGKLADLAGQLLEKFHEIKFEKWAKGLASLSKELKAFEKYESYKNPINQSQHL